MAVVTRLVVGEGRADGAGAVAQAGPAAVVADDGGDATSRASSSQSSSIHIGGVGVVQWQASRWHAVWPVPAATFTSTLPPLSVTVLELTLT